MTHKRKSPPPPRPQDDPRQQPPQQSNPRPRESNAHPQPGKDERRNRSI